MVLDVRTVSAGALFRPNVRTVSAKSDGQDTVHNGGRVLFFFHCITKNRLGADRCTRMYVREEDILKAICLQLKDYVNKHYITNSAYKQKIQKYARQIADITQCKTTAWINAMEHYEQYVQGKINKDELRAVQDIANQSKEALIQTTESKTAYEKQYDCRLYCQRYSRQWR